MPIRLNLLAEAQAAEEQRRRDPVKRAIWIAGLLVCLMLAWSSSLQLRAVMAKKDLGRVEAKVNEHTNAFHQVQTNGKNLKDAKFKLEQLDLLAQNRFLNGNLLNALQQTTVDDVQLVHFRIDQSYVFTEGTKPRTNETRVIPGKPATWTEKSFITLDGSDTSANPGDLHNKFKDVIIANPYFKGILDKTNPVSLKGLGQPIISPDSQKLSVLFTLEYRLPEKTR